LLRKHAPSLAVRAISHTTDMQRSGVAASPPPPLAARARSQILAETA
jgi:hypothetical protein